MILTHISIDNTNIMRYNITVIEKRTRKTDITETKGGDSINGFEKYRLIAKYTQQQVAQMLGVNQSSVSTWENGTCYPTVPRLKQLAELYGCSIENLLEGQNIRHALRKRLKEAGYDFVNNRR